MAQVTCRLSRRSLKACLFRIDLYSRSSFGRASTRPSGVIAIARHLDLDGVGAAGSICMLHPSPAIWQIASASGLPLDAAGKIPDGLPIAHLRGVDANLKRLSHYPRPLFRGDLYVQRPAIVRSISATIPSLTVTQRLSSLPET